MPSQIRMANGVDIPFLGLGTGGKSCTPEETEFSVRTALDLGYKHIDTAASYGTEKIIGRVLKEYLSSGKIKRNEIFITTKLPCTSHGRVESSLKNQLADLQLDFVDLYLIHSPCGIWEHKGSDGKLVQDPTSMTLQETWKQMEDIYTKGLAHSIGLSNFNVDQIQRVYSTATIKPHNLQIELHAHFPQKELVTLCQSLNICLTAYAPLGCPSRRKENGWPETGPLDEPIIQKLTEKYKKTSAQLALRHLTQRNIVVIPKSTNAERLKENLESMHFFLTDGDLDAISHIKPRGRLYLWENRISHPEYPFTDD